MTLDPALVRRLRAVALTVVVVANLVAAIPRVKLTPEELADPELWTPEIAAWHQRTGLPEDQLRTISVSAARFWMHFVKALRFPFEPFFRYTHTNQQWGLFAIVAEHPERLVIEVRRDGEWERVYRRLDPAYTWHEEQLKYRRIRGIWDSVKDPPKGTYKRFSQWVARTAFAEDPAVDRVRVKLEKQNLTLPWEPVDDSVSYRAEKYYRREKLMAGDATPEPPEPPAPEGEDE